MTIMYGTEDEPEEETKKITIYVTGQGIGIDAPKWCEVILKIDKGWPIKQLGEGVITVDPLVGGLEFVEQETEWTIM